MTDIRRLLKVTIRPTSACDRGCSDCYDDATLRGDPTKISEVQEEALVNEILALTAKRVRILIHITGGGEPLLYPRLPILVTSLLNMGAQVTFTTSGCTGREKASSNDLANLSQISTIRNSILGPVLSTKVTLPKWRERFRYTVSELSGINGLVTVRQTVYDAGLKFLSFLNELGYQQVDRRTLESMPPTFYRKDLIVPGENSHETIFQNKEGVTLQVISHEVIMVGRAKGNDRATVLDVSECPFLMGHTKPYVDIWSNGVIYPCFIIGPEIPNLSLGILGQMSMEEALRNDDFEERRVKFKSSNSDIDCLCDKCRD